MWVSKNITEFKGTLKSHKDNVIHIGSLATATVSLLNVNLHDKQSIYVLLDVLMLMCHHPSSPSTIFTVDLY